MAKAKAKLIRSNEAGNVIKLPDGRFRIDCVDSKGRRHRPAFPTKEEAFDAIERIAAKKSKGEFLAAAATVTFDKALDLLLIRNEREGLAKASRLRVINVIDAHLRPTFGTRKLSDFPAQRMRFVQEWLDNRARDHGASAGTLMHARSYLKLALDEAIKEGWLGAPNPVTEFNLRVPRINARKEREVLTLDEITKLVRVAAQRYDREHDASFRCRFLLVMLGLLAGLRDQECGALCWDCVNFDDRQIYIRRKIEGGELVDSTKTGKKGFRTIPMSPILHAALLSYRDLLQSQGREVDGKVPILLPGRAGLVTQNAVGDHWDRLARKAGFIDTNDTAWPKRHTFYVLRHTCLNLWRTIDIRIERLSVLAGHTNIQTTHSRYLHETPHFEILRGEVHSLGLEQTPAGLIDGLGIVLARRWQAEGIEIVCAPLRSETAPLGLNGSAPKLLAGNYVDVVPTTIATEPASLPGGINSLQALRDWQLKRAQELHALSWTKRRIADDLGLCTGTISSMVRTTVDPRWMRKTGRAERATLMQRCHQLRDEHPLWSSTDLAKELGVRPHRVVVWERKRGRPMPHRPGLRPDSVSRYERRIREMVDADMTFEEMAAELARDYPDRKTPSRSGINAFCNRLGLGGQSKHRTSGLRIDNYADRIREMVAAGKNLEQITRDLDGPSRSGIAGFINRMGLQAALQSGISRETR